MTERPYVGGQAVIEGVMMRAPRSLAVAVRRPDGTIVVKEDAWISIAERLRFLRWPFFRGSLMLLESVYNGLTALNFAAAQAAGEGEAPSKQSRAGTIALAFVLAAALFIGLPHLLAFGSGEAIDRATGAGSPTLGIQSFGFHALDGAFKLLIFVGYIWSIGQIPEVARVFQYHGAEHKVVNVYESHLPLSLENARRFTTFHARCGTSFMLFVLLLSIVMFAAVIPLLPVVSSIAIVNHVAMIGLKIPLMIPLAGIAYEINRYAARHPGQIWVQALVLPGRMMQKLTTREPTDDQLEIALAAMQAALRREARLEEQAQVLIFKDFAELNGVLGAQ
jgi:uncharacterized protein YqhQ